MTLWLALFTATWCVYGVLAAGSARGSGRDAAEVLSGVAVASGTFFVRSAIEGTSVLGALRGATLVSLLILVITAGRPARIFDPPGMKARDFRRLPREQREAVERRGRATLLYQGALLVCIVGGTGVYILTNSTFLD